MAIVDLSTGEIYGCEKGSKTYYHELGHIEFSKTYFGQRVSYYQQFFQMISVFFLGLGLVLGSKYLIASGFVNALGMICSYIYEEVWCWAWGLKQFYKK